MARKSIEFERLDMRQRFGGAKAGDIRDGRVSTEIQEHAVAVQSAHAAVLQAHFNGLRSDEAALAKDQFGAAFLCTCPGAC